MSIPEAELTINTTPAGLLGESSEDEYATVRLATWRGIPVAAKSLPLVAAAGQGPFLALDKEIEVLSCLRHPHLVPVCGVCHHPAGCTTLVEELVPGDTLYSRLHPRAGSSSGVPLPFGDLARVALDIARALASVHAAGVTHGGIDSRSILLHPSSAALLMDFGLATYSHSAWARVPATQGFAPEASFEYTPQSDVHSLGSVMIEMASGKSVGCMGPIPALTFGMPRALSGIMCDCWEKDPASRPTAAALVSRLELLCQVAPPTAVSRLAEELRVQTARAEAAEQRARALEAEVAALRARASGLQGGVAAGRTWEVVGGGCD